MTDLLIPQEKPHAEFGPSSLKYVAACRGWKSRGGTSEAAEMGNRIHTACEHRNPAGLLDEREQQIYEELIAGEDRWLENIFGFKDGEAVIHKEIQLDVPLPYDCSTFGTSDVVAVLNDVALVLDYKSGIGEIDEVEVNKQSKAYAVGVFHLFPSVNEVHSVFLIPQRGEELHGVYTREQLPAIEDELARIILLAKTVRPKWFIGSPEPDELSPNGGCQYCAFADRCPALGNAAFNIAARYEPEWVPEGPIRSTEIDDPDALAKLYPVACIVEKWAEGIKRKSVLSGLAGLPPTGYRMRSMGATRKITDTVGFLQIAKDKLSLDTSELMQFASFPYAQVRDFYSGKAARGKKTAYAKEFEEVLSDANVIEAQQERFTLVKDS